jgi:hypothetical protein
MFKSKLKLTRYGVMAAVIALSLVWMTGVHAGTATFSGEITTSDTNIQTGYPAQGCLFSTWPDPVYAEGHTYHVTSTGSYSFTGIFNSGFVGIGVFRDSYSQANCVNASLDAVTVNLMAGQTYVLNVFLCDLSCNGFALGAYSVDVSGPGDIISGSDVGSGTDADSDNDGVPNDQDNCAQAYNPSQEDGWGSGQGDACDTAWYNQVGVGVSAFVQKSGLLNVHGNCAYLNESEPRCPEIAILNPSTFTPDAMPLDVTTENAGNWSGVVYYLHSNDGDVYQVNIYSTNPPQPDSLIDDRLEIHVHGSSWKWYQRGGDVNYGGLPEGIYSGASGS